MPERTDRLVIVSICSLGKEPGLLEFRVISTIKLGNSFKTDKSGYLSMESSVKG